jgi:MFS family permease
MSIPTEQTTLADSPEQQARTASTWQVLKNRNFLFLWIAQLISLTILNAANFGLVVLVQDTTHSVILAGLAIIAFQLPAFPFGAIAGVIVDWLDKRQVLWISNILRMGTMLLMCISLLVNPTNLWPLFALIFLTSLIGQFFTPAEGSSIPLLVGENELMAALGLFNVTMTISMVIGFLLLGGLVAAILPPFTLQLGALALHVQSIDTLFLLVALLYAVCAGLLLCIPASCFSQAHVYARKSKGEHIALGKAVVNLWHDMVGGWEIVRADGLLFFSVIQLSIVGIIMVLIGEVAPSFVQQVLHRPATQMSIVLAPAGVGLVGASIVMPHISERVGKLRLTVISFIVLALGFLLLPASQWLALYLDPRHGAESAFLLWTTVVLVFVLGAAIAAVNVPTQTLLQEHAPDAGRARVLSLQFMLYNVGSIPVLLFAGMIAQYLGFPQLVLMVSLSLLIFCWWGSWYVKKKCPPLS